MLPFRPYPSSPHHHPSPQDLRTRAAEIRRQLDGDGQLGGTVRRIQASVISRGARDATRPLAADLSSDVLATIGRVRMHACMRLSVCIYVYVCLPYCSLLQVTFQAHFETRMLA